MDKIKNMEEIKKIEEELARVWEKCKRLSKLRSELLNSITPSTPMDEFEKIGEQLDEVEAEIDRLERVDDRLQERIYRLEGAQLIR